MTAYDITLMKNGETVQPENIVKIKIPCDNPDAKIYRNEADGNFTDMNAVYKDGYMIFYTDHFSIYILVETNEGITTLLGDVDGSGYVDMVDATILQRYVTLIAVPYDEDQLMCADVDGDGVLTVVDATFIQRYATKVQIPCAIGEPIT